MMHHSNLALALLLLGSAVPSNALLRGAIRKRGSGNDRDLGSMSMGMAGGGGSGGFRTDETPDCDDLKKHPMDILEMFGVDTDAFVGTLDCNPANIRSDNCMELAAAEEIYGDAARAAMGIHCTQNVGPVGVGCRPDMQNSERWACLSHSKEWFCGVSLLSTVLCWSVFSHFLFYSHTFRFIPQHRILCIGPV